MHQSRCSEAFSFKVWHGSWTRSLSIKSTAFASWWRWNRPVPWSRHLKPCLGEWNLLRGCHSAASFFYLAGVLKERFRTVWCLAVYCNLGPFIEIKWNKVANSRLPRGKKESALLQCNFRSVPLKCRSPLLLPADNRVCGGVWLDHRWKHRMLLRKASVCHCYGFKYSPLKPFRFYMTEKKSTYFTFSHITLGIKTTKSTDIEASSCCLPSGEERRPCHVTWASTERRKGVLDHFYVSNTVH